MDAADAVLTVLQVDQFIPRRTRMNVFRSIYWVFVGLGTLVGVVVVGYMTYVAYRYRAGGDHAAEGDDDRPTLGELPTGGGKGRKLFVSFALSAVVVVSLVAWTYGTLLYVESPVSAQETEEELEVEVVGRQFAWQFVYPNGHTSSDLRVPTDTRVRLVVTSADVFHNFGIPGLRAKTDAIPGQTTETWFVAERPGEYQANCYELCGAGHSAMTAEVVVMDPAAFEEWYATTGDGTASASGDTATDTATPNGTDGTATTTTATAGTATATP